MNEDKEYKQRSKRQNNAMHLLFSQAARQLNEHGIGKKIVIELLSKYATVPWNTITVKEDIWRPIQKSLLHKDSSADLVTVEIDQVFDVMSLEVLTPLGIEQAFPSIEEVIAKQRELESYPQKRI